MVTRLEWLMFFRVVLVTLLLGSTLVFRVSDQDVMGSPRRLALLSLIIGTYSLTIIYALVLRVLQDHFDRFAYIQLAGDLIISALLVSVTGGTESLFLVLFSLCVLAGSILLSRRGALFTMLIATVLIVLVVLREALGWWIPTGPNLGALCGTAVSCHNKKISEELLWCHDVPTHDEATRRQ